MRDPGGGPRGADEPRGNVEVVVLEEQRRIRAAIELLHGRVGERPVDRLVRRPRRRQVCVGIVLELPEPVLDEPEHGVREDAVEQLVHARIVGDEPDPERRAGVGLLDARALGCDRPLRLAHRAGDPRDVVPVDERPQCRHETAGASHRLELAGLRAAKAHGPAIRDDDERPAMPQLRAPRTPDPRA